mmetsp:Transcript_107346/g.290904  ORF Transcript_107346/g.290904 Transcript_107346/m.290904 type:complete len:446 (+) Transcript_107346:643-1980(+)
MRELLPGRVGVLQRGTLRSQEHGPHAEHGGDRQRLARALVRGRLQQHPGELWVHWQRGALHAQLREFASIIQAPQVVKRLQSPHKRLWRRRVDELEADEVCHAQPLEGQHRAREVRPQHLRARVFAELLHQDPLVVEPVALPGPGPARAVGPAQGRRPRDRGRALALQAGPRVVEPLPLQARVDHVGDAVDGDGRFRDARRDHHPPRGLAAWSRAWGWLEGAQLLLQAHVRVQCRRPQLPGLRVGRGLLPQHGARPVHLLLAGQEHQDVPRALVAVYLDRRPRRRPKVVLPGLRHVVHLHWVRARGHAQQRRAAEVALHPLCVHCGRHDDELQFGAFLQGPPQQRQQHVGRQGALVSLIEDDDAVLFQLRVRHQLVQERLVRDQLQQGLLAGPVLEPADAAHVRAEGHLELVCDALGRQRGGRVGGLHAGERLDAAAEHVVARVQ